MKEQNKNVKGKRRNNGRKQGSRANKREYKEEISSQQTEASNDVSWYAANPQLLADAASLSFSNTLGTPINIATEQFYVKGGTLPAVPGIMSIHTMPTVGTSNSWTDPINLAARSIYTFVRHANSGHSNYDAPDLMKYLMAADGVFSMYAFLCRVYGLMSTYSVKNRYLPKALIESMGVDFESIFANLANFRYFINTYVQKAGVLCVPRDMNYFMRHIWMYSNVYMDAPTSKSQLYLYTPEFLYGYSDFDDLGIGHLLYPIDVSAVTHNGGPKFTFQMLTALADGMVNDILTSEDMNIMAGDILKAYGPERLWKMVTIPAEYSVVPVYDAEVLTQIHNLTVVGAIRHTDHTGLDTFRIEEDKTEGSPQAGALVSNPAVENWCGIMGAMDQIIDLPIENPTPADVMVASRLKVSTTANASSTAMVVSIRDVGSEAVACLEIYRLNVNSDKQVVTEAISYGVAPAINPTMSFILAMEKFGSHPILPYTTVTESDTALTNLVCDLDNYTVVNAETLRKLHTTAMLSLFAVPIMGRAQ